MKCFYSFILLFVLSSFVVTAQNYTDESLKSIDNAFSKFEKYPGLNYTIMLPYNGFEEVLRGDVLGLNAGKEIVVSKRKTDLIEVVSCSNVGACILEDEFRKIIENGNYVLAFQTTGNCSTKIYTNDTSLTNGKINQIVGLRTNCSTTDRMFRYIGNFKMSNIKRSK